MKLQWINQLLQGADGSPSTMRVAILIIVLGFMANWVYLTIHTGQAQPLDWQTVSLIVGSLGAKAAQVKYETAATATPPPAAPKAP